MAKKKIVPKAGEQTPVVYRKRELVAKPGVKCAGCVLNNEDNVGCKWENLHIDTHCVLVLEEHFQNMGITENHVEAGWDYKD